MKNPINPYSSAIVAASALFALAALPSVARAQTFTWPISGTSTPDVMNTSFGPRIEDNAWDFHDGLDLPASCDLTTSAQTASDTVVRAVADGTIHAAGTAGQNGMSSRHVILRTTDADGNLLSFVYLHLKKIDAAYDPALGVALPKAVTRGAPLGLVGRDGAQTCHLHLEVRRGGTTQEFTVHPLHYLPYSDTANWSAPLATEARFNGTTGDLDARLVFTAPSKLEGDLVRVEVDARAADGSTIETRVVDFDDKTTISEGSDDSMMFNAQGVAVEGYQAPDMITDGRTDLHYGVLVRAVPANASHLVARIFDLSGLRATSAPIAIPARTATTLTPSLSGNPFPPAGWTQVGTSGASISASGGKLTAIDSASSGSTQRAAIEAPLPAGRFQWFAKANVKPTAMSYSTSTNYSWLLYFGAEDAANLSVTARIRKPGANTVAGLSARTAGGTATPGKDTSFVLATNTTHEWALRLLRLGTRESTAVLVMNGTEIARMNWDARGADPRRFRAGLGASSPAAVVTIEQDSVEVTELVPGL
ncbi:M23 family metallopeptidase [Myxococcota bacterium]|nr:M23 family metallopeptidase [Myxococcota bacterium]